MSHWKYYLPLLPSGPDGFHSLQLHRTRPSTPLSKNKISPAVNLKQEFSPAIAVFGYRAPLVPRLARLVYDVSNKCSLRQH